MGVLDQYLAGREARRQQDAADQANAMQGFLQQNGQAIFSGDQNALGQLAGMGAEGLTTAFNVQGNIDTRNRNAVTADREAWRFEKETTEYAKSISAEQAAKEAAAIENAVKVAMVAESPQQFDALMDQLGQPELKGQFDNREALAAQYMPMAEVLKMRAGADPTKGAPAGYMWTDPNNPAAGVAPLPGMPDKTQAPFTPEGKLQADLDAGRITPEQYQAGLARLAPKGTSLAFDPATGAMTFTQGGAANPTGETMIGDVYNPGAVSGAIELIDDILKNPSLGRVTGPLEGGGGNNIDELSAPQRMWYGSDGLDAIDKTNQLQSKAWLAARAMLKGGGQITDYESKKAEAAVARLSRAKGEAEFKAALTDLRDAITEGEAKLKAAGKLGGSGSPADPVPADSTPSPQSGVVLPPDLQSIFDKYK